LCTHRVLKPKLSQHSRQHIIGGGGREALDVDGGERSVHEGFEFLPQEGGVLKRERERERQTDRQRETDRQTDRQTERERERERKSGGERERR